MDRNNQPRPRGRPRDDRARDTILEITRAHLLTRGYDRLSIHDVAEEAGVGKQTVYRWWPTRSVLVADAVLAAGGFSSLSGPPDSGDVARDLRAWMADLASRTGEERGASLLRALAAAAAESEPAARQLFETFTGPHRLLVVERLQLGQRLGQVRLDAPLIAVADALVGVVLFRVLGRQPLGVGELERLVDVVFAGIAKHR